MVGTFFAAFFIINQPSLAASYDAYVDKGYENDDSDGSSDKPYKKIEDALEKLGSKGGEIYIKNGTYGESLSLDENFDLFGQSKDKTIIKGSLTSKGNNKFKNLTIVGGSYGIDASGKLEVDNCKIKGASKIGINLEESDKEASVTNSVLSDNGKGIYVQRKRQLYFSGNSVYGNAGEGIDIRERVNGTISGNEVTSNGEGGIEIIVGGTNVKIQKNTITKNKASGIAVQFYSFIEKTGSIIIENNTLSKNGHFGLLCGIPSGGKPSGSYWDESIELKTNVIEGNKSGTIEKICNIIAIDEEEEKENTLINKPDTLSEKKEEDENEETKEQIIKEQLDEQAKINDSLISASNQNLENLKKKNSILLFLLGTNKKDLDSLENKTKEIDSELSKIKNMLPEIKNSQNLDLANLLLRSLEDELEKNNQLLEERKGKLSLFGWIPRLFE